MIDGRYRIVVSPGHPATGGPICVWVCVRQEPTQEAAIRWAGGAFEDVQWTGDGGGWARLHEDDLTALLGRAAGSGPPQSPT